MPNYGFTERPEHGDSLSGYASVLHSAMEVESRRAQRQADAERSAIETAELLRMVHNAQVKEREERLASEQRAKAEQETRDKIEYCRFLIGTTVGVISGIAAIVAAIVGIISLFAK